jgi:hypothetical protein
MELLIQGIGVIGLIASILVWQLNKRKQILYVQIIASIAFAIHFVLLGAITAGVLNGVGAIRNYTFSKTHKKIILYFFITTFIVLGILTWKGMISILPIIGMIAGTISFYNKNPKIIRAINLIASPAWLLHNVLVLSYAGILTEIFILGSTIIGVLRFDVLRKHKKKAD